MQHAAAQRHDRLQTCHQRCNTSAWLQAIQRNACAHERAVEAECAQRCRRIGHVHVLQVGRHRANVAHYVGECSNLLHRCAVCGVVGSGKVGHHTVKHQMFAVGNHLGSRNCCRWGDPHSMHARINFEMHESALGLCGCGTSQCGNVVLVVGHTHHTVGNQNRCVGNRLLAQHHDWCVDASSAQLDSFLG